MRIFPAVLIAGLVAMPTVPAVAQNRMVASAARPAPFESWTYAALPVLAPVCPHAAGVGSRSPGRRALIGGVISAVAGVAACTVFSNLAHDHEGGFSTCTGDGYLLFGSAGFALGFGVGWAL